MIRTAASAIGQPARIFLVLFAVGFLIGARTLSYDFCPDAATASPAGQEFLPILRLSLAIDHALYGDRAWGFHLSNVLCYALTCALLGLFLYRLSGSRLLALFAGCLFAVHPVNVEPVAWIDEGRGELLGALLALVAALVFLRARRAMTPIDRALWAVTATVPFTLAGLASVRMLILPICLLLVDAALVLPGDAISRRPFGTRLKAGLLLLTPQCLAAVVLAFVHGYARSEPAALPPVGVAAGDGTALARLGAWLDSLGALVVPVGLRPDYAPEYLTVGAAGQLAVLLFGALLIGGLILLCYVKFHWEVFGGLWLLASSLVFLAPLSPIRADRYLVLPVMGFSLLLAALAVRAGGLDAALFEKGNGGGRPWLARTALFGVAVAFLLQGGRLSERWQDSRTLWMSAAAAQPHSLLAPIMLREHFQRQARARNLMDQADVQLEAVVQAAKAWRVKADGRHLPAIGTHELFVRLAAAYEARGDVSATAVILTRGAEDFKRAEATSAMHIRTGERLVRALDRVQEALTARANQARKPQSLDDAGRLQQQARQAREQAVRLMEGLVQDAAASTTARRLGDLFFKLAKNMAGAGHPDEARRTLQQALNILTKRRDRSPAARSEIAPLMVKMFAYQGHLDEELGDISDAIVHYRLAVETSASSDPVLLTHLGNLYRQQSLYALAEKRLRMAIDAAQKNHAGRAIMAGESSAQGRRYFILGSLKADLGDYESALQLLEQGARYDPDSLEIRREIKRCQGALGREPGRQRKTKADRIKAMELFAKARRVEEKFQEVSEQPPRHLRERRERAIRLYKLAVARDLSFVAAHYRLARLLVDDGQYLAATQHLEICADINRDDARYPYLTGVAHQRLYKRYEGQKDVQLYRKHLNLARQSFLDAVKRNRKHADAWLQLAWIAGLHDPLPDSKTARIYAGHARRLGLDKEVDVLLEKILAREREQQRETEKNEGNQE